MASAEKIPGPQLVLCAPKEPAKYSLVFGATCGSTIRIWLVFAHVLR